MAVKIRLQRHGKKNFAFFHIVVADSRSPRDGRYIEEIGTYNPNTNPATIVLKADRALAWLNVGAQPTLVVRRILSYEGVLLRKHLQGGVAKGALTQEQADQKFEAWKAQKDAKINAKIEGISKAAAEAVESCPGSSCRSRRRRCRNPCRSIMHSVGNRMLKIAKVLKSNGTDGDVIISFTGILPEDIDIEEPVFIYFDGLPVPFYFESFTRRGSNKAIARLTGIRTLADADEIAGSDVYADEELVSGEYEENDFSFLEGWSLQDADGHPKGTVSGFLDIPNNPCLEIMSGDEEIIIPLHDDLIEGIDEDKMILRMRIPDGLIPEM